MKKVHMTLVARMTQEPVASRSVWTTGMHAQNWTIGQFAMWLAHVGEVGRMVAGEPVGLHPPSRARILVTRGPLACVYRVN